MAELAHHIEVASGYLELGMFDDASNELEKIAPEEKINPAVIGFRVALYSAAKKWTAMEVVAREMVKAQPEEPSWWVSWAYASRRAVSIEEANRILLEAEKTHPQEGMIQFNLGCYACQMGDHEEAKRRVATAISLDKSFRVLALDDLDLEPLWQVLATGGESQD